MSPKRVDFFYDYSCPYAYLGHTQIEAVCARAGAELSWKPFLLGGVFRALETPLVPAAVMSAAKARHNFLDMARWADHFGVPLRMPAGHPNRTVLALRATLRARAAGEGALVRASKALFAAYWVEARDLSDPEVVRDALDGAGLDGAALVASADTAAAKDALRAATDEAIAAGVFGAPAFVVHAPAVETSDGRQAAVETSDGRRAAVEGDLYWGQDRLDLVERALGGWHVPSFPIPRSVP